MAEELKPKAESKIDLEQEILNEAFTLMRNDPLSLEKKIRATALLMEALTEEGSEAVSGAVAYGFAEVLRGCAQDASRLRKHVRQQDDDEKTSN
jgi:hypothetical protein